MPEIQLSSTLDATQTEIDFLDSSFFTTGAGQKSLPNPTEVTARSKDEKAHPRPAPVKFEPLNLLVKFGLSLVVEEALCLRMIRKSFADKVPVPEVYGWRVHQNWVFIYMELIRGDSLHNQWASLSEQDKTSICDQLQEIISLLRQARQDSKGPFIGSINRQRLRDYVLENMPWEGPFKNVKEFNDWFSTLPQHWLPASRKYRDPYRDFLPDTGTIRLTHGDLHQGNVIISSTCPPCILAVVDWTHAGWYPEYWEYCKALYTSHYEGEWRNVWIPKFLTPYETEFSVFADATSNYYGCVHQSLNISLEVFLKHFMVYNSYQQNIACPYLVLTEAKHVMSVNRVAWRNVHLYDASTGSCIGGFLQRGSINEGNLIWILSNVLLIAEQSWTLKHRTSGRIITSSSTPVAPGDYDIHSIKPVRVSNEPWVARLLSHSVSGREDWFRENVRSRDRKCVISGEGEDVAHWNVWTGLHAAHVFPLEHESLWIQFNYGRWITNMDDAVGVSRINSTQNGLLMRGDLHTFFDQYLFSINPDDGYKIIWFSPGGPGIDGRILDPVCRDPNSDNHVSDELLRWHFRQSVLANMRDAGEPIFESDFPPGTDKIATLREEPYGKERFEMEVESRLKSGVRRD